MEKYICENLPRLVNACGLISDIIGVVLLWKFGIPEPVSRQGHSYICWDGTNKSEIDKAQKYDKYAKVALLLIIGGFVLQFISDFL
jgi:hypothetical protein